MADIGRHDAQRPDARSCRRRRLTTAVPRRVRFTEALPAPDLERSAVAPTPGRGLWMVTSLVDNRACTGVSMCVRAAVLHSDLDGRPLSEAIEMSGRPHHPQPCRQPLIFLCFGRGRAIALLAPTSAQESERSIVRRLCEHTYADRARCRARCRARRVRRCAPSMRSSDALQRRAPATRASDALQRCAPATRPGGALQRCAPAMRSSDALQQCAPAMRLSDAPQRCVPATRSSDALERRPGAFVGHETLTTSSSHET
jgi:hypothetical protein